jgi:hypothetical protein
VLFCCFKIKNNKKYQDKVSTANEIVLESIKTGEPLGYQQLGAAAKRPKSEAEVRCEGLTQALQQATEENGRLANRVKELELRVQQLESEGASSLSKSLNGAKMMDAIVNGE